MLLFRQCKAIKTKSINSENIVKSVNSLSSVLHGAISTSGVFFSLQFSKNSESENFSLLGSN